MVQTLGKAVPQFLIKLFSSQDPAIAFFGLYPKKFKAYVHTKNLHMHVYSILTHNYQNLEANKWSFRRGMDKQCYIWQRYYSAMKTLKRLVVARDWREREINRQGTKDFQGSETTLDDTRMMCGCVCVCVHTCARSVAQLCQLLATLWTVACQAPLSMGFARQEYWTRLPCPPPGDLPDPRIELASLKSLCRQVSSLPLVPPGSPSVSLNISKSIACTSAGVNSHVN